MRPGLSRRRLVPTEEGTWRELAEPHLWTHSTPSDILCILYKILLPFNSN